MAWGELSPDGRTLRPLKPALRSGLLAITILAAISFFISAFLFLYLTYRLAVWHMYIRRQPSNGSTRPQRNRQAPGGEDEDTEQHSQGQKRRPSQRAIEFALGIDGVFTKHRNTSKKASIADKSSPRERSPPAEHLRRPPNQFLILVYNLMLADMHQSVAFALNSSWIYHDGIMVGTRTCFTQGFFVSTGDLSSSMFITLIAVHTYLSVVKGYRPSQGALYITVSLIWLFVYLISTIPIAVTRNGAAVGGWFVRAGSWCWINGEYERLRLLTHYLFIFIALGTTTCLYVAIWLFLRRRARQHASSPTGGSEPEFRADHNPAFLMYPIIYVMCTLPLATGRAATMAGANVPLPYMCFAGALISFNGFFDCVLFATTRHAIIFGSKYDVGVEDTGMNTIAFLQTPKSRRFGNMVWVEGCGSASQPEGKNERGWWSWQRLAGHSSSTDKSCERMRSQGGSQETLHGPGIHMDMVTTVVVEVEDKEHDDGYPSSAASGSPSVNSTKRDLSKASI